MSDPKDAHQLIAKGVLKGTQELGLIFDGGGKDGLELMGYVDSDWGGNREDRQSTTGYVFMLGGAAVSWKSKLQLMVAASTTEVEYMATYFSTIEVIWI